MNDVVYSCFGPSSSRVAEFLGELVDGGREPPAVRSPLEWAIQACRHRASRPERRTLNKARIVPPPRSRRSEAGERGAFGVLHLLNRLRVVTEPEPGEQRTKCGVGVGEDLLPADTKNLGGGDVSEKLDNISV